MYGDPTPFSHAKRIPSALGRSSENRKGTRLVPHLRRGEAHIHGSLGRPCRWSVCVQSGVSFAVFKAISLSFFIWAVAAQPFHYSNMSILTEIGQAESWQAFFDYKLEKSHMSRKEAEEWADFIARKGYEAIAAHINEPGYCFAPPEKRLISKQGSSKKRVVYSFSDAENRVLKLIAFLLYRYDGAHAPNCYSFRRNSGALQAVRRMTSIPNVGQMFCAKLDVHDYFNSIDVARLLPMLKNTLADDPSLYAFLARLLCADQASVQGVLVHEKRGVMAGTPISPFLANLYLGDVDRHFLREGIPYARYSDDILFFAPTRDALDAQLHYLLDALGELGLCENPNKTCIRAPKEAWSFLGVSYAQGQIDLSPATRDKLKAKLRRKARSLCRWRQRKEAENTPDAMQRAMRAYIRAFNRKFYEDAGNHELTWSRWFFPLLTRADSLAEMDAYMQQCIRYLATGAQNKAKYRIRYETMKECGYRSLVNEYYRFKKEKGSEGTSSS